MSESANYFYAGPTSGSPMPPAFRLITADDIAVALTPTVQSQNFYSNGGFINLSGPFTTSTAPFYLLAALQGTTSEDANSMASPCVYYISGDNTAITSGVFNAVQIKYGVGGNALTGTRQALSASISQVVACPSALDNSYVGALLSATVEYNNGGVNRGLYSDFHGGCFGANPFAWASNSATYFREVTAAEFNVGVSAGCIAVGEKYGFTIIQLDTDALRGTYGDAAVAMGNQATGTTWINGIQFGQVANYWPFGSDSTLITAKRRAAGGTSTPVALWGLDLNEITFQSGGGFLRSNAFMVDPIGNIYGAGLNVTGGLSAATASVSSVTLVNGGIYVQTPTFSVAAPPLGTAATITTTSLLGLGTSYVIFSAGTGYVTGNTVTAVGGTGTPPVYTVTAVGGAITALTLSNAGNMAVVPSMPCSFTTSGSGAGFTAEICFKIATISFTGGSGYSASSPPTVSYNGNGIQTALVKLTMSARVPVTLTLNSPGGDVQIGSGSVMATTSTTGFLKIPFSHGSPTGTPSNSNGPAVTWNDNSKTLNIYSPSAAGWYHLTGITGAA